jgi:hypothetical protein
MAHLTLYETGDPAQPWTLYEWTRHEDSGQCLGFFRTRAGAVAFALAHAARTGADMWSAPVLPFPCDPGGRADRGRT